MNSKKNIFIFVTGFFGSPIEETARAIADKNNLPLLSLDAEIERADGRSARRICMVMGEHEYRNKEYETIKSLIENGESAVVFCGDGVLHDDMSRELIKNHSLVIVGDDMSCDDLWEKARSIDDSCHAFMLLKDEKKKESAFKSLYERQSALFMSCK